MSQLPSTQYNIPYNDPNDVGTIPYNSAAHQVASALSQPSDHPFFPSSLLSNILSQSQDTNSIGNTSRNTETYERELQQMQNLGFFNRDLNIVYLQRSRGNVQDAINLLLDLGE